MTADFPDMTLADNCVNITLFEPHHEKLDFLPFRKQRCRSAVQ